MSSAGKNYHLSGLEYGIAGALAGVGTRFVCQPLDVLKIRFQLQTTPRTSKEQAKYRSMRQSVGLMVREEGFTSLWKGQMAAQLLSVTFGVVQFPTYELLFDYTRRTWDTKSALSDHLIRCGCGTLAGLAATVVSFPFDVLRTHLIFQGEPKMYKGLTDVALHIYQKEGALGFTKGMGAAALQTAPMSGLTFSFKGIFREVWLWFFVQVESREHEPLSTPATVVTSLLAGICAKTLVYPLDLTKKRLQIQGFDHQVGCSKDVMVCSKISQCLIATVRQEGFLGLFKGLTPSVIKAGASTAVYFTLYDKACAFIEYINRPR